MTPPQETPPQPKRRYRWLGIALAVFFTMAVLIAAVAGVAAFIVYDNLEREGTAGEVVRVTIPRGASGERIGTILHEAGLVAQPVYFRLAARMQPEGIIRSGHYDLPQGLSARQLLELLYAGPSEEDLGDQIRVRIPEGWPLDVLARQFDDPKAFLEAARDPELITTLGIEAETLEGFIMPDTYFFTEEPDPAALVARAVRQFQRTWERLAAEYPEAAAELGPLRAVTIAALIEREARTDEERAKVAGVIFNRLARRMTLDMDSTLQYLSGRWGERVLNADKDIVSPYNTYRNPGLPPGPIVSPGEASLRAALNPAEHDYLYFVSNADGITHTFSRTLQEHNRAVARFRQEIAVQRAEQRARGDQ